MIEQEEGVIKLLTTTADSFILNSEHPFKMSDLNGVSLPEVKVRHDLWARFSRNAWYELLEFAQEDEEGKFYILDRKSTRLNSSHVRISYAVFCLKKKKKLAYLKFMTDNDVME